MLMQQFITIIPFKLRQNKMTQSKMFHFNVFNIQVTRINAECCLHSFYRVNIEAWLHPAS